jgi:hypothetical protein
MAMNDQTPGPVTPIGTPGPLTQAAIDKAKSLPDNQLDLGAGTTDFRSVDLTVGVRKTWRNGWGAAWWIGAKIGAGKPTGSTGVTVTKSLGLLGEVDTMNWLQRNLPARESWAWPIVTIASVAMYLSAHFELVQAAFEVGPRTQARIELVAGLAAMLAAKQSFSWMPTKDKQEQAKEVHAIEKALDRHNRPGS